MTGNEELKAFLRERHLVGGEAMKIIVRGNIQAQSYLLKFQGSLTYRFVEVPCVAGVLVRRRREKIGFRLLERREWGGGFQKTGRFNKNKRVQRLLNQLPVVSMTTDPIFLAAFEVRACVPTIKKKRVWPVPNPFP